MNAISVINARPNGNTILYCWSTQVNPRRNRMRIKRNDSHETGPLPVVRQLICIIISIIRTARSHHTRETDIPNAEFGCNHRM